MGSSLRFGSALMVLAIASTIGGCAAPQTHSGFGGRVATSNVGAAMRALAAIQANDFAAAIPLAEQAVQGNPADASLRSLLGNAYFGAGRFASAEAAYRDSLTIQPNQPQLVLKLALVQIAQGKNDEAVAFLDSARDMLAPADYGLALALAGRSGDAIAILEPAARSAFADARIRQNLALAYAFAGDWTKARVVAGQDLPADQLDGRIQQWMALAKPAHASDQVAALTGIAPAAVDPGQPTQLALRPVSTRSAEAAPAAPQPLVAEAPVAPQVAEAPVEAAPAPAPAPVALAAAPISVQPVADEAVQPAPVAPVAPVLARSVTAKLPPARTTDLVTKRPQLRPSPPVRRQGNSTAVVQLGAYGSPQRVLVAWDQASRRFSALRAYAPVSARFNSQKGLVYRLSVKGFASASEASQLCASVKRAGGSCFVRSVAGDVPVQMASR